MLGHVVQFHAETQVGFIRAVPMYRITIFHAPERSFCGDARRGAGSHHHLLDDAKNGVLRGK